MSALLALVDEHDALEREFAASLHGVDLKKSHQPGHSSNQTTVGLQSFYWDWHEKQAAVS